MSFYLKKYMWVISLVAVAICSYFLARMTANLIAMQFEGEMAPPSYPIQEREEKAKELEALGLEDFEPILKRNIFDSRDVGLVSSPVEGEDIDELVEVGGEAVPTSLKIKLVSTFSVGKGEDKRSTCVVSSESGKGEGDIYIVDDEKQFAPDTRIVRILYNRVEFVNKNRLEYIELEDFTQGIAMNVPPRSEERTDEGGDKDEKDVGVEKQAEGAYVIDRSEVDDAIANLDKLYTQIRAVPHFSEGRPSGLKLLSVRSGSIFSKLGLRRGDILQRINGLELDIKRGLEIFNQLKNETRITIDLERRGGRQTLDYEIR